ncbi:MAG: MarR family winged helix-turn-helix transcriptional regulator [Phycisphaerales bacterium]
MRHYPRVYFACHRRHVRDPRTAHPVSSHAVSILDHLDCVEAVSVSALARHMGVTPSTMSLALDRLEARAYIRRRRDPTDARRIGIVLTASGERLRGARSVLDPDLVQSLMNSLTAPQRAAAVQGLALLSRAAQGMDDASFRGSHIDPAAARRPSKPRPTHSRGASM